MKVCKFGRLTLNLVCHFLAAVLPVIGVIEEKSSLWKLLEEFKQAEAAENVNFIYVAIYITLHVNMNLG